MATQITKANSTAPETAKPEAKAKPEILKDKLGKAWEVDEDVPRKYRRMLGDKAGKRGPRQCSRCQFWTTACPQAAEIDDKPVSCNVAYHADPERGPTPEEFRCSLFVHKENATFVDELRALKVAELRILKTLAPFVSDLLSNATTETVGSAMQVLLKMHPRQRDEVLLGLLGFIIKDKATKAKVEMNSWYRITDDKGDFLALAVKSTANQVVLVPEASSKRGGRVTFAPELFQHKIEQAEIALADDEDESDEE